MGMIKRVYGRDERYSTCYLTRIKLTPKTQWGQLYFHFFHRGDYDHDHYDHPYDFWTFPFRTYYEEVLDLETGRVTRNAVKAWRWHFRPAEYTHMQIGAARYRWRDDAPLFRENIFGGWTATILFHRPVRREWGFWGCRNGSRFTWTPWNEYIYNGEAP